MSWAYTLTVPDQSILWYAERPVGEVWWVNDLVPGQVDALDRIVHGLNTPGLTAARSTWSYATPGSPARFELRHNGFPQGELVWTRPLKPTRTGDPGEPFWAARAVAGLNDDTLAGPVPYPADIRPRHLRAVS